ncbi:MAG: helix-hairpin-helix domain-containing protein [Beijerinckiaceae bacterium]|nr:helix-hairpin-helix domain-containing protein [Beijerinckiaceae bacterium]
MRSLLIAATLAGSFLAAVSGPSFAQAPAPSTTTTPAKPAVTAPPSTAKTAAPASGSATAAKPAATLIDINSATVAELQALKGVGPARAEAIVKGRPYKGKDDLTQKNIVPSNVYNDIKDQIIARQK